MAVDDFWERNDVMLVATRGGKVAAAGWFNLDHSPTREEKAEVKRFYRDSAGLDVQILRGDEVKKFKTMEWAA